MNTKTTSKFLCLLLRHQPDVIGIRLDPAGWADINELVERSQNHPTQLTDAGIREAVANCNKQRFSISDDGQSIRANQGHSVEVDLGLAIQAPPAVLYHGTATRFLDSIMAQGLKPQSRQHVHLSLDTETANKVGQRHGKPVVLTIDAQALHQAGQTFYVSANGIWLTGNIPKTAISVPES